MNGTLAISDSELFLRAREGDQAAFGELIDRHKAGLVNYLTYLCGDLDRAEDLAQEAFIRLYERGTSYRDQGKLQAYLFRIGSNLLRSQIRKERRRSQLRRLFLTPSSLRTEAHQDQRLLSSELGGKLADALMGLPLHFRMPLVLAYVEGWSYREIGRALGCREGTIKTRIHRGRKLLRQQLESYYGGKR
ncbi:MAG: RNA polymerase sigma factor [Acidobacteriota bacterium]